MNLTKSNGSRLAQSSKTQKKSFKKKWPKFKLGFKSRNQKVLNKISYIAEPNSPRIIESMVKILVHPNPSLKPKKYLTKGVKILTDSNKQVTIVKICAASKLAYGVLN